MKIEIGRKYRVHPSTATPRFVGTVTTQFYCAECGKIFSKVIGPRTYEVKCPKCGSTDVEVI